MEMLERFNPGVQKMVLGNVERCYFGTAPTLALLNTTYGENAASQWLVAQLFDLSEFCGCKTKISEESLKQCSYLIAQMYFYLKVSELMLYFQYFKSGKYGIFYGAVDAMKITTALREFCEERNEVIARHEREEQHMRDDEYRKKAISYNEYKRMMKDGEKCEQSA